MRKFINKKIEAQFIKGVAKELASLLIDRMSWPSFLQEVFSQDDPDRTWSLQSLALAKVKFSSDETASFIVTLITSSELSRESYFYCLYLLRHSRSRIAMLFIFYAELTEKYEFKDENGVCDYLLHISGIGFFQDTTHANHLAKRILKSSTAQRDFQNYAGYFQEAYLRGDFSFSDNRDLFLSVFHRSSQGASAALGCLSVCLDSEIIIDLTKQYLKLHPNGYLGELRSIIQTLGTLPDQQVQTSALLEELRSYKSLEKHINKSINQLQRLASGKTKSYKNPMLRYRSQFIHSFGVTENSKHLGFMRWQDETDRIYGSRHPHFSEEEIRECVNQVREESGLKKIGEGWTSETLLYKITKAIMKEYDIEVLHHYRPKWLAPQEVDVYFKVGCQEFGIEYQGIQHYKPIKVFGGVEGFENTVKRDKKKRQLCEEHNLKLLFFKYTDSITEGRVRILLEEALELASTYTGQ